MKRDEYLARLGSLLEGIPKEDRDEILYDYREHFRIGMEEGKTEEDIAASLGDVNVIARQFRASYTIKRAETDTSTGNILRAVFATVAVGFFNLVFVLGPFFALLSVLIGMFATAFGLVIAGAATLMAVILAPAFSTVISIDMNPAFVIFASTGLTCMGLLFFIGDVYVARYFFKITLRYLKWNLGLITGKKNS